MLISGTLAVVCMKHLSQAWSVWGGWVSHSCLLLSSCHWSVSCKEISWRLCTIREHEGEIQSMALLLGLRGNDAWLWSLRSIQAMGTLSTSSRHSTSPLPTHQCNVKWRSTQHPLEPRDFGLQRRCFWSAEAVCVSAAAGWTWAPKLIGLALGSPCRVGKESCTFAWEPVDIFVLVNAQS